MYKNKKILAIIPARGGSKGIKHKNTFEILGKPLINYTIDVAKSSKYIDKIHVSTDAEYIAEVAKENGIDIPFLRPNELASDEAPTILSLIDSIEKLKKLGFEFDYLLLLQPTQPLRLTEHIDKAIEKIIDEELDDIVSVSLVNEHPILMRTINGNGQVERLLNMNSTARRQDFPDFYKVNGSLYINKIEDINADLSLNDNKNPFIMDSKYDIDIDEMEDIEKMVIRLKNS